MQLVTDPTTTDPKVGQSTPNRDQHCSRDNNQTEAASEGLASQDPLWERLDAFKLDLPECGLTFSERAAKENAWSLSYTRRVIEEYKRFVYLAMKSGHVACPSEDVDQVWHMHLTYTRSYWDEMCNEVLRAPLHHGPTKGGSEEREKYFTLYGRTKTSYEEFFGVAPPEDIWPAAEVRFGEDLHYVRVNSARNWILPKLGWKHAAYGAGSAGVLFPIAQLAVNPLNWSGPEFLALFFGLLVIAVVASLIGRYRILSAAEPYDFQPRKDNELGPIEAAWMQGGDQSAISCALVGLAQSNAVELDGATIKQGPTANAVKSDHRVSDLILGSVKSSSEGRSWKNIARDAHVGLVAMKQSLEEKGLVTTASQRALVSAITLLFVGGVGLLGAAKIWVGMSRNHPVGILIFAEVLTAIALALLLFSIPRMTRAGMQLLQRLRKDVMSNPEALSKSDSKSNQADDSLLWGTALLGTGVLAATPYADLGSFADTQIRNTGSDASGGCGATGCGGDSGCGGGGGCGGGCGGCGGCGG